MGNYEQLKQAVSSVIKNNGNYEITGDILQNTLLSIISTVGGNATFAGIATPETNPGTPDQNVFYLASENGTYSNFGGVELTDQVLIFANTNGQWVAKNTNIPLLKAVNEVRENITNILSIYSTPLETAINSWIGSDGTLVQVKPTARVFFYKVSAGTKISLILGGLSGNQSLNYYHYAFYNSETEISSSTLMAQHSFIRKYNEDFIGQIVAPEGAVLIGISVDLNNTNDIGLIKSLAKEIEEISSNVISQGKSIEYLNNSIDYSSFKTKVGTNSWIGENGDAVQIAPFATTQAIFVKPGQKYRLVITLENSGPTKKRAYALYSDNILSPSNFISGSDATSESIHFDEEIEIPENCKMLAWSESSSYGAHVYCLTVIKENTATINENTQSIEFIKANIPYNSKKSNFGILPNTQGITEDEAKNIFSEVVVSEDVKTYYIESTIQLKKISDDSIYGLITVDPNIDDYITYPIYAGWLIENKEIKGYAIINAANIVRASYGNYFVYFDGNKKSYQTKMNHFKNITEIILWGDSLTAIGSGYGSYFSYPGKVISVFGVGGENTLQILGRIGASPYLIRDNIVIPDNIDDEISISLKSSWNGNNIMPRATYGLNECIINGIKGTINIVSEGNTATFKRSELGEQIEVKAGTEVLPYYYKRVQSQFNVYWIGQNGGWSSPDELLEQFKTIAVNQANGMFLFITPHLNTSDQLEDMMQKEFGIRYINMRKWCVLYGLQESGITPTEADNEAIAQGICPPSLLGDGVHFVESAKKAQAAMIKERINELFNL